LAFGIERILDGLEALIAQRASQNCRRGPPEAGSIPARSHIPGVSQLA
jgi:hypothetical protein